MTRKYITLGEACEKGSSNIMQKDLSLGNGPYKIYGASGLLGTVDFYTQEKEYIGIVKDGAGVGRAMLLPEKSSCIGTMQYLIPKEHINVRFLFYAIESMNLAKYNTGATIPHIYFKDYKKETLPLFDLQEQAEIVRIFDKIRLLVASRQAQLKNLDELVKSQFIEMFGDPFVTSSLEKKPLRAIAISIYDGANIPKDCYLSSGDIVFYRIQNVWRNEYRLDDLVYISEQTSCKYADSALATDDILITKIGRYYTKDSSLGRVSIYKGETGKAHFSNNIMRVRLKPCLLGDFLNVMLNLDAYQSYIKKISVGGTDKRALSKTLIGELPIIVPPLEAQKKFVHIMEQTDKSKVLFTKFNHLANMLIRVAYFGKLCYNKSNMEAL